MLPEVSYVEVPIPFQEEIAVVAEGVVFEAEPWVLDAQSCFGVKGLTF